MLPNNYFAVVALNAKATTQTNLLSTIIKNESIPFQPLMQSFKLTN